MQMNVVCFFDGNVFYYTELINGKWAVVKNRKIDNSEINTYILAASPMLEHIKRHFDRILEHLPSYASTYAEANGGWYHEYGSPEGMLGKYLRSTSPNGVVYYTFLQEELDIEKQSFRIMDVNKRKLLRT